MKVVEFLRENWSFISSSILIVLSVILMILKRKPVIKNFDIGLTSKALSYVIEAEEVYGSGHGAEKLEFVIRRLSEAFPDYEYPEITFRPIIESILSSPQKKE